LAPNWAASVAEINPPVLSGIKKRFSSSGRKEVPHQKSCYNKLGHRGKAANFSSASGKKMPYLSKKMGPTL